MITVHRTDGTTYRVTPATLAQLLARGVVWYDYDNRVWREDATSDKEHAR